MQDISGLSEIVLKTLDFFEKELPPRLDISEFNLPFVVGSGNAYNTGLIIFSEKAAIAADESNYRQIISSYKEAIDQKLITDALVISASGGKDSVWEVELSKDYGLRTTLMTTKEDSPAAQIADRVLVYKSIDEPYTYNTSTYMGMILSATNEGVGLIKEFINSLNIPANFNDYKAYTFVLPDRYSAICPMLDIKKSELFGPKVSLRAFSQGHARHAKFVIPSEEELIISIGQKNEIFGVESSRWDVMPPRAFSFAGIMALTYYIVGKIQDSKPAYFKENIKNYVSDYGPKAYGSETKPFDLIVPGTK